MRLVLSLLVLSAGAVSTGCDVRVQEKPAAIIKRDRDVDINVQTPRVDIKVRKN